MAKIGCIAFVPDSGGQTEIVDHLALTFADGDQAVHKIDAVLSSTGLRRTLQTHLSRQASKFSVENSQRAFRSAVYEFLQARKNLPIRAPSAKEASLLDADHPRQLLT